MALGASPIGIGRRPKGTQYNLKDQLETKFSNPLTLNWLESLGIWKTNPRMPILKPNGSLKGNNGMGNN